MSGATLQDSLRITLVELMAEDERVFVIGEDVGLLGGAFGITAGLLDRFGAERVRDAPISETAILGAAIGAALMGMRPICEMQFVDFLYVALDQVLHQAALAHFASGGANTVPLVIRANYGVGPGVGSQDTSTLYGALLQFPGLTVLIPSGPSEAASLLRQAVLDRNPILFLEPRELYRSGDPIADPLPPLPMTRARILRKGEHLTCVAVGGMVRKALAAADRLAAQGVEAEIIDLRCVMPLDEATIVDSAMRTGRLLALDEAPRGGGLAAEVLALVGEAGAERRRVASRRLTAAAAPVAYAPSLAAVAVPDAAAIERAMRELANEPAP